MCLLHTSFITVVNHLLLGQEWCYQNIKRHFRLQFIKSRLLVLTPESSIVTIKCDINLFGLGTMITIYNDPQP